MLEPGAHPGSRNGFRDARRRQLRRVVLHAQTLTHDIGVNRFQAGQPCKAPLENRHLFVAVHSLDLEDRLGVQLTDATSSHKVRLGLATTGLLRYVRPSQLQQVENVMVVNRIEDLTASTARPDEPHRSE